MPLITYYLYLLPGLFSQCGNSHSFFQHVREKWLQLWQYLLQIRLLSTNYIEIYKTNSILTFYWGIVDLQCCISFCCTTVIQLCIHNFIYCEVKVTQSCLTLCDPWTIQYSRIYALFSRPVTFPFSRGSFQPRDQTQVSHIAGRFSTSWGKRKAQEYWSG